MFRYAKSDTLRGTSDDDIRGLGGNDKIEGRNDGDALLGGGGDDRLSGEGDSDYIEGGRATTRFSAGAAGRPTDSLPVGTGTR